MNTMNESINKYYVLLPFGTLQQFPILMRFHLENVCSFVRSFDSAIQLMGKVILNESNETN
ncbi:hypothetical protein BLOT_010532 [Blomia tropicalis]|nr:hypothetical protein BLOT_010532 [Blomia tropicalis]